MVAPSCSSEVATALLAIMLYMHGTRPASAKALLRWFRSFDGLDETGPQTLYVPSWRGV